MGGISAGELRHRVDLQSPGVASIDASGGVIETWTQEASVWAGIEPLTGREQFVAAQVHAQATHKVTLRYSPQVAALTEKWSVLFGTRRFLIEERRNLDEGNCTLELICIERVAPG